MSSHNDDDIAIIGMACRTAGANSPSDLWDLLVSSRDVQSEITRFNPAGYYDIDGGQKKGLTNVKRAYMMDDTLIDHFDHAFFHIPPTEARCMDPQQRHLLELSYEAMENAGIPLRSFIGSDTAVFAGLDGCDYASILGRDLNATPRYAATGTAGCMAANRISYFFDLHGPSMTIDTACSSSMTALHQALRTLQYGDSRIAIVCGAKMILTPDMFMPSTEMGFLSPSGRCRSFDADGDGYGRGKGALALLLKPLKQAIADNDPIRAVIKGIRVNQDGRTQGITMPSSNAQKSNIEALYARESIDAKGIQYAECHGTGTAAGDPKELRAINAVFNRTVSSRPAPLVVGSVKSNVGHLESAAALVGIVKTVLSLEHAQIPPQMHFKRPNPGIDFNAIRIPTSTLDWPDTGGGPRRAAVNCFGAGGTNGHCVLEAWSGTAQRAKVVQYPLLFKVSAEDEDALRRMCDALAEYADRQNPDVRALAYTLLSRRSLLRYSYYFSAETLEDIVRQLRKTDKAILMKRSLQASNVIWIFTGQGAQWPQMGCALLHHSPVFRKTIEQCDYFLAQLVNPRNWSISEELRKERAESRVYRAAFAQPLCTALQLGLVELWKSWGFSPSHVVGHSSGEIAAAYAAGCVSLRDAIVVAHLRGKYFGELCAGMDGKSVKGAMCAVGFSEATAKVLLEEYGGRVQLAAVNSPTSCTLSGDKDAVEEIVRSCKEGGLFCRELMVDIAYHSHHVLPVAEQYQAALVEAGVKPRATNTSCMMYSSVTGEVMGPSTCTALYWKDNMTSTVRFAAALSACAREDQQLSACSEIGPHPALKSPAKETLRSVGWKDIQYFSTCVRGNDDLVVQLDTAGALLAAGIDLSTPAINGIKNTVSGSDTEYGAHVLVDLPPYPWDRSVSLWSESHMSRRVRFRQSPRHPLLGSRYLEDTSSHPSWRCVLDLAELPWVQQTMRARKTEELPQAAFVAMALEAARQLKVSEAPAATMMRLFNAEFAEPLVLTEVSVSGDGVELHLNACRCEDHQTFTFEVSSVQSSVSNAVKRHFSGIFSWSTDEPPAIPLHCRSEHDPFLLQSAEDLGWTAVRDLQGLSITSHQAHAGSILAKSHQYEHVDAAILNSLLELPMIAALGRRPAIVSELCSIGCVGVSLQPARQPAELTALFASSDNLECASEVQLSGVLTMSDIRVRLCSRIKYAMPLRSLFYRLESQRDITCLATGQALSLDEILDLATHKWPMCDIGIVGIQREEVKSIVAILRSNPRPRFRSVQILCEERGDGGDSQVRYNSEWDRSVRLHLLISWSREVVNEHLCHLGTNGVAVYGLKQHETEDSSLHTPLASTIASEIWTVLRPQQQINGLPAGRSVKAFCCHDHNVCLEDLNAEEIDLSKDSVEQFLTTNNDTAYHALVLDHQIPPIICSWPGSILIPFFQRLLSAADSVTWISRRAELDPFAGSAASLLRTLQSERLSLKVANLVFDETMSPAAIQAAIAETLQQYGGGEMQRTLSGDGIHIPRWYPDDELGFKTGTLPDLDGQGRCDDVARVRLSEEGAYAVVGGLGGLGRHVCAWLVSQGAKHLYVLSRSGPSCDAAQELKAQIEELGASLVVFKTDARERAAVIETLSHIRHQMEIKGVINMAMLLSDAPLAEMMGVEWDRALRLKVDSSWNLHKASLHDKLDFFIVFSSIASVLGNRNQAGYNCGNAFLNALAEHRRARGLPGVAIALGAMTDVGVLHDLGKADLLMSLTRSGLTHMQKHHLDKVMQAAVQECADPHSQRAVILTGLEMFERVDGKLMGSKDQTMLYWMDLPEFAHLQVHRRTWNDVDQTSSMKPLDILRLLTGSEALQSIQATFVKFLGGLLGLDPGRIDCKTSLTAHGLDSLSGVSCQYWFHRELNVTISVPEIFATKSIGQLLQRACEQANPE